MKSLVTIFLALLCACGGDEAPLQSTLEFEFRLRGQDADGDGTLVDTLPVDFAEGAPWRVFADQIENDNGSLPETLSLSSVSLRLLESSLGADDLGDVFNGPIALRFQAGGNQAELKLAVADVRAASEAKELNDFLIEFNYALIGEADRQGLMSGPLQILFVGQAGSDFRDSDSVAEFAARLNFMATAPSVSSP